MGRFGALKEQKQSLMAPPETPPVQRMPVTRSKRDNPAYAQFSAYIPKEKYLAFKSYAVGHDIEVSEAVEQAIDDWMRNRAGK
jgi:hypothetical protein